jgi:UDP-N-acetyl-D-galactosamine dehydrogenase
MKIKKIAVIGLGYVGLPLAIAFQKNFEVIGYDLSKKRIKELTKNIDTTYEISSKILKKTKKIFFTSNQNSLRDCDVFVITVPTPINKKNLPDLRSLKSATKLVGKNLKKGGIVIYESTTYPGCTEEVCIPILEKNSKLKINEDFGCGYSPERINPGDKKKKLDKINKLVSASNQIYLIKVYQIYRKSIKSKVIKVNSIKIAEGAKIIENTQRDLNIALINELSIIFKKLNINFFDILSAASTKWNFLPFEPGLVGGHCIGVDPYYLAFKSKSIGYEPKILLAGRKLNDSMSYYLSKLILKLLNNFNNPKILIMGLSFKENVPDIRNSKSFDLINNLKKQKVKVDCYDNMVNHKDVYQQYKIRPIKNLKNNNYNIVVILVKHRSFILKKNKIRSILKKNGIIYDFKNIFNTNKIILKK